MIIDKNHDQGGVDIAEAPTGEYPVLDAPCAPRANAEAASLDAPVARADPEDAAKAAFWLNHLESEVSRLHVKWHRIEAEFKDRDARIAELNEQIAARDGALSALAADLERGADALRAAEARMRDKDAEIAGLGEDRRARDERIAVLATEIAAAEAAHQETLRDLERAKTEAARLADAVKREQAATAATVERNERLVAEQRDLNQKVQDLEIYISGRHDIWAAQSAKLAEYKENVLGLQKTLKSRDAASARQDEERRQLAERVVELERQSSELAGRRKERETAYEDLQQKLAGHIQQTEQLKTEHAVRMRELEHMIQELTVARDRLASRADDLEKGVAERSAQLEALRTDLRMAHEQLRSSQQLLSDRTMQLAASQETLDQKARHVERLVNDLDAAQRQVADARAEFAKLEEHATVLGDMRAEALAETEHLRTEVGAQRDRIASLEAQLERKQVAANLLERNVERITELGASLAALDRDMSAKSGDPAGPRSLLDAVYGGATLAVDDRGDGATDQPEELLPIEVLLGVSERAGGDGSDRTAVEGARRLVGTIGGEAVAYPLTKSSMTIGRAHSADIRIPSHFVSRVHAKISTNGIATIIEDVGSKNGILVNTERVSRRVLRHGDVVSFGGELDLRFFDAVH